MTKSRFGIYFICLSMLLMSCRHSGDKLSLNEVKELVDIGTHKLWVIVSDLPSDLTVVLEAGGGEFSDAYQAIQDTLAQATGCRVMSYDRSGYGKSELGPAKFNALDEVSALKKCLEKLGVRDNLILVGHSYGGFLVQLFTTQYPEMVRGLVLIDPMNVLFVDRFGLDKLNAATPYFENPVENFQKAGNRMVDGFPESLAAQRGRMLPPEIPVILITAGIPPAETAVWRQAHEDLVSHSEKHQLIVAEGNHHHIVAENPALVLETIIRLCGTVQAE